MKKKIIIPLLFVTLFIIMGTQKTFAKIVTNQKIRLKDFFGEGYFGSKRTDHIHEGIDIVTQVGEAISSPISGTITRFPFPYADDLRYKGIEIKNNQYTIKIFYVNPVVAIGTVVSKNTRIAIAQDLHIKYGDKMTNHAHFEVRETATGKLVNPTNLF